MRWTKYRGLEKVATHTMLVFAAMNLKKLATWLWKGKEPFIFLFKGVLMDNQNSSFEMIETTVSKGHAFNHFNLLLILQSTHWL